MPIVVGNQVHCQAQVPKTARPPDPVEVGLTIFGKVKVNYNVDRLNINSSCKQVYETTSFGKSFE